MADMAVQITLSARDDATDAINKVREAMGGLGTETEATGKKTEETKSAFDRIKEGFEEGFGIGLGYLGIRDLEKALDDTVEAVVGFNAELETASMRLENLTGSVGGAADALQGVRELADSSPFEFKDIEAGEERLLRFNFSIDESSKLLKVAADAAAGGAGSVDSITEAFGRMNAKEELTSRGLMSLTAAGIPVFDMLANGLGVSTAEAEKLVSQGLIPATQGIQILSDAIEAKFPDMAAKVATGFDGTIKNLKETITFAAAEMGKPLFDALESAAQDALTWLKSPDVQGALDDFSKNVASTFTDVIDWFKQLGAAMSDKDVQENLHEAWDNIRVVGEELWGLVKTLFIPTQDALNTSMGGGAAPANEFAADIKILSADLRDFTGAAKDAFGPLQTFADALNTDMDGVTRLGLAVHNDLIGAFQDALSPLQTLVDMLNDLQLITEKVFHVQIDIPGQAGLQAFLDSIHQVQTVTPSTGGQAAGTGLNAAGNGERAQFPGSTVTPAGNSEFIQGVPGVGAGAGGIPGAGAITSADVGGRAAFQQSFAPYAAYAAQQLGIDPSIVTAMAISESGGGNLPGNSFFGMKGSPLANGSTTQATWELENGQRVNQNAGFATFADAKTSMDAWVQYIQQHDPRAIGATTPEAFAEGLKSGGYMTDTSAHYAQTLRALGAGNAAGGDSGGPEFGPAPIVGQPGFIGPAPVQESTADILAKVADPLNKAFDKLIQQTTAGTAAIQTKEDKSLASATTQYGPGGTADQAADSDAAKKTAALDSNKAIQDNIAARKADLAQQLQDDATANAQKVAADALVHSRSLADDATAHSRQLEDNNILVQQQAANEATVHARALEDQQTEHQQALTLAATEHSQQLQDAATVTAQQVANVELVHQRTLQNTAIQLQTQLSAAATLHQRQVQDAQVAPNEQLQDQATGHSRQLQDAEVVYQAGITNAKEAQNYQDALSSATTDAQRAADTASHQQNLKNIAEAAQAAAVELAHQRTLEDAEAVYQQGIQAAAVAAQRKAADEEAAYQQGLAATALVQSRALQDTEIAYQDNQKQQQVLAQRALAVTESQYQMGLAKTETDYQRGLQDQEVTYQQGLAAQALVRTRADQDAETVYQRGLQDKEVAYQLTVQAAARAFTAQEKAKTDALDKTLADEAFARQKQQVVDDLAAKKASIAEEYAARVKAITDAAATERATLKIAADQKAADQIAAAQDALKGFLGQGDPVVAAMQAKWDAMDATLATAAQDILGNAQVIQTATDATAAKSTAAATTVTTAVGTTVAAYQQSDIDISRSLGISDLAVETYADRSHQHWGEARTDLNNAVTNYGVGSKQISDAFGITDKTIEQFALDHHEDWDKARTDLNAAALNMTGVLGTGGTIPTAAGQSSTAIGGIPTAIGLAKTPLQQLQDAAALLTKQGLDPATKAAQDLQTAISEIKDRTITVTTQFNNSGVGAPISQAAGDASYASSVSALGKDTGSTNFNPVGSSGNNASTDTHASPFGASTIGSSGPGGKYNDPSTGQPYTHATGGVTTGPIFGTDSTGGQHTAGEGGSEAIIPLDTYFVSKKSDANTAGMTDAQMQKFAAMVAAEMVQALKQNGNFSVGVDEMHSAFLRKAKATGRLGLSRHRRDGIIPVVAWSRIGLGDTASRSCRSRDHSSSI